MKCDICYTMIPMGKNRCPNCGYVVKKTTGIKSTTMEFNHIEESDTMPTFDHIKDYVKMPSFDHISVPKKKKQFEHEPSGAKSTALSVVLFLIFYIFMYIILS